MDGSTRKKVRNREESVALFYSRKRQFIIGRTAILNKPNKEI